MAQFTHRMAEEFDRRDRHAKADAIAAFKDDRAFMRALLNPEPWPHYVHYFGTGRPHHCPPDRFSFMPKRSITACDWIVPGTLER